MSVTYIYAVCDKCGYKSVEKESELGWASFLKYAKCPHCKYGIMSRERKRI